MKRSKRRIFCACMVCLTSAVALLMLLFLPETIQAGMSVQNGVKTVQVGSKFEVAIPVVVISIMISVAWELFAKENKKMIDREPEMKSYRVHRVLVGFFGVFYHMFCTVVAAAILICNL